VGFTCAPAHEALTAATASHNRLAATAICCWPQPIRWLHDTF